MKLIDLLVQELPKRGGWPDGAVYARVTGFGGEKILVDFLFPAAYNKLSYSIGIIACHLIDVGADVNYRMIRRDLHETALAESQNPTWNGEGLPPVGCECEVSVDGGRSWCTYRAINEKNGVRLIEIGNLTEEFQNNNWIFRPLRSESEMKHEAALESICAVLEMVAQDYKREDEAKLIYEAIAAGKIPGVKLED